MKLALSFVNTNNYLSEKNGIKNCALNTLTDIEEEKDTKRQWNKTLHSIIEFTSSVCYHTHTYTHSNCKRNISWNTIHTLINTWINYIIWIKSITSQKNYYLENNSNNTHRHSKLIQTPNAILLYIHTQQLKIP